VVQATHPLPTAPAIVLEARRKIAQAKRQRLYSREPWRDPESDQYDPLRLVKEKAKR
jgi:hypothetical protein